MSHHDYEVGRQIAADGHPFYALIQAAMRQADSRNLALLVDAFPEVFAELQVRYDAPGGLLPDETIIEALIEGVERWTSSS